MKTTFVDFLRKQVLVIDQLVSAATNYTPILIPLLLEDWAALGQISLFQSFYVLILGITRSSLGTSQLVLTDMKYSRQLLLYGFVFSILAGLIAVFFLASLPLNMLTLIFIFTFPILQDILRFEFVGQNRSWKVLESDSLWLITSVLIFVYPHPGSSDLTSKLLLSWSLGAAPAAVLLYIQRRQLASKNTSHPAGMFSIRYLIRMGSAGLLSEVNTIYVNWIIAFTNSAALLGNFRYFQIVFLPISFLINLNRLLLIPLYRQGKTLSISNLLKIQVKFRILFYILGFSFTILKSGIQIETISASIVTALSVEVAFRRNIEYQNLFGTKNERIVITNLILYLASSVIIFTFVAHQDVFLLFSVSLLVVESLAYLALRITHTENNV
jgi:hypothetical protein